MKITLAVKIAIEIENCNLLGLSQIFLRSLCEVFGRLVSQALRHYAQTYKESGRLAELLDHQGGMSWKSLEGKLQTRFYTIFGKIDVPQIQVYLHESDGRKRSKNITRLLLGVSCYQRIPDFMKELMGMLSSLCSYRTARQCVCFLGSWKFGLGSFRRAAFWLSGRLSIGVSPQGSKEFGADGTGVSTLKTGKRGSELKVLIQWMKNGAVRLVNIGIGRYKNNAEWQELFTPLTEAFDEAGRKQLSVIMDGCKAILAGAKSVSQQIKIQRDIWHICHQLKYYMWKDKVSKGYKIALIKNVFKAHSLTWKRSKSDCLEILASVILFCDRHKYLSCRSYLMSCAEHLFTFEEAQLKHRYSSKLERMMRTANQRMDIGVWSDEGALAIAKIRLAYFYNGWRAKKVS